MAVCTNVVSEKRVSRAKASIVASSMSSASRTTASWLPVSGVEVKTSSQVTGWRTRALLVEVEVARRALLEPQAVVVGRLLEELRGLLEDVLAGGLVGRRARGW